MKLIDEYLQAFDPAIADAIALEVKRQRDKIELIASENFTSRAVMAAQGSVLTNKYAEGYPSKRYYGGCEYVDIAENLARDRACELFGASHANVQPHSGSQANMAAYQALLSPGDKVLGMNLNHGGHLTHGSKVNFSGQLYEFVDYGVNKDEETIDYERLAEIAQAEKPKLIVAGASAYPRQIDFARISQIAKDVNAYFMVDMAHIAGLVATGLHPSPVPHADVVTSTTHKTLRGPRGGIILCKEEHAKAIDKALFPGIQGGPLMHVVAAKAVALGEALQPDFKVYMQKVVANAKALAEALKAQGFRLVSDGTDNHLVLIDVKAKGLTGSHCEAVLDECGVTVNMNTIPFDTEKPTVTSGVRIGTPAVTTRGMDEEAMGVIADIFRMALLENKKEEAKQKVADLLSNYPLYEKEGSLF